MRYPAATGMDRSKAPYFLLRIRGESCTIRVNRDDWKRKGGRTAVEYALQLKESDALTLPRAQVRALLRGGDGNAALLYLFLAEAGGEKKETEICAALHWAAADLSAAAERLRALGVLGQMRKVEEPLSAPPERARTPYSRSDIAAALERDASFAALRQAVGEKLCRLMTEKDDDMLLGLYSDLGLGADVIFSLVGHCVERTERRYGPGRRPTMRQVEKEGYRWKRLGLVSAELVEEYLKDYARRQQIVPQMMEALHMGGRAPVSREAEFLDRWIGWGFSPEAVEYGYEKTVFKLGRMDWKYLNGILKDLDKKGLHTLEEITAGDKPPQSDRSEAAARRKSGPGRAAAVEENDAWMDAYLKEMDAQ